MGNLLVEHAMKKEPITIDGDTTVKKAAELMRTENVGCLPVVDSLRKIEGIITRTDLIKTIPAKED
jgi:CBS domain-containing protein